MVSDIRPGDVWRENDGDICFIKERSPHHDSSAGPAGLDKAYYCVGYYPDTSEYTDFDANDDVLRWESDLDVLIYRQDDGVRAPLTPEEVQDGVNALHAALGTVPGYTNYGGFITRDSGERVVRESGYQRDIETGKPRFDLTVAQNVPYQAQFFTRFAQLLERGAEKYGDRNWEHADQQEDLDRFKSSAYRHLMQWLNGELDEDHAAAVVYNLYAFETTKWKMLNG